MTLKLSICIPIFNCSEFVGQALDSILPQTTSSIEVIIYDGGSTDDTPSLLEGYLRIWANLQYHRGDHRGGIDIDMATCASFAQGEYIWLFSGDDVMRPDAIIRALKQIESGDDIYICSHTICNKNMTIFRTHPVLSPNRYTSADLSDPILRLKWFQSAVTTEAFFSFMSGLIVRRAKWQSGLLPDDFKHSCWGHVARFFGLIQNELHVVYVADIWLDQRGGNDSFADKGIVNRYRIAIDGYHKVADTYFGVGSEEAFHIRRVIRNEFGLRRFLSARYLCNKYPQHESRDLLDQLLLKAYCDNPIRDGVMRFAYRLPIWDYRMIQFIGRSIIFITRTLKRIGNA